MHEVTGKHAKCSKQRIRAIRERQVKIQILELAGSPRIYMFPQATAHPSNLGDRIIEGCEIGSEHKSMSRG